jgi:hypothetical protein
VPIVISALQSACCHHCQSKYIKKVKHILNLGVFLAVVVNLLPEDAGSIFP